MTNADLFTETFNGLMATELWSKSEQEFLDWLNKDADIPSDEKVDNRQFNGEIKSFDKEVNSKSPVFDFAYSYGYFKALLDFKNAIKGWDKSLKSKKQYTRAIESYLKVLTEDSWVREKFMEYGGDPDWMEMGLIMTKDGEVKHDSKRILPES